MRRHLRLVVSLLGLAVGLVQCQRPTAEPTQPAPSAEPPTAAEPPPGGADAAAAPSALPPTSPSVDPLPEAGGAPPDVASPADADASSPPRFAAWPVLQGEDGADLPQTEDRPSPDSPFFEQLGPALFAAIVRDDPSLVTRFFFPLVAYEQVKDIAQPARDWDRRLMRLFQRDLHDYHRQLGRYRDQAQYVTLEVPESTVRWMKPGSEGNKVGYFRVLRAHLIYLDHQQRRRRLEVTSMISWRGEWYVVHLNGFK